MSATPVTLHEGYLLLTVRLTPNARQEGLEGVKVLADGKAVLAARVRAVPEDGAANAALVRLVAARADVPKSRVAVVAGHTQRVKVLRIDGAGPAEADALCRQT